MKTIIKNIKKKEAQLCQVYPYSLLGFFIVGLATVLLSACETESEVIFESELSFINGEVIYIDAYTKDTLPGSDEVVASLSSLGGQISDDGNVVTGRYFQFGPLPSGGSYEVNAEFYDAQQKIIYAGEVKVDSLHGVTDITLILSPSVTTISAFGSLSYQDLITTKEVTDQPDIVTTLQYTNGLSFSSGNQLIAEGSSFQFDSLSANTTYRLKSYYADVETGVSYELDTLITLDGGEILINMPLRLQVGSIFTIQKGTLYYMDPITNTRKLAETAEGDIHFKNELINFEDGINTTASGTSFAFGPLEASEYIRKFSFFDGLFDYLYTDTVTIDEAVPETFEELTLMPDKQTLFKGTIYYTNPITGEVSEASTASGSVQFTDIFKDFEDDIYRTSSGSSYTFGPLVPDEFLIRFEYNDGVFDHVYEEYISPDGENQLVTKDISLELVKTTALMVKVTDQYGNAIGNADVFLYKNYDFLQTYLDDPTAAIAYGVTASDGTVVFSGLDPGNMYAYVTKAIGNDQLTNLASSATPAILAKDVIRILTTTVE